MLPAEGRPTHRGRRLQIDLFMNLPGNSSHQRQHKEAQKGITKNKIQVRVVLHAEDISNDEFNRHPQQTGRVPHPCVLCKGGNLEPYKDGIEVRRLTCCIIRRRAPHFAFARSGNVMQPNRFSLILIANIFSGGFS
jgi:hypothetical protein